MTYLPVDDQNIEAAEGPDYKVGPKCCTPFCDQYTDHAHHVVRRSFIIGDVKWVKMPDGVVIGNLVPLCWVHHKGITENRFRISYNSGKYWWDNFLSQPEPIRWQPPSLEQASGGKPLPEAHVHTDREVCTTCGRPLPKPKIDNPTEEPKKRKTWAVMVPESEIEDGANTLDDLVEAARLALDRAGISYGEGKKVKYYPLATSMAIFVQHAEEILSDS